MTATALHGAALYVVLALLAACAMKDRRAASDPVADLRAYDTCAATAAPWEKAREEVIQFFRERVPLATAVDVLLITARTAAGERVLIPTDEVADALSRHAWRTTSINPLQDWASRDERGPLVTLRRCLAERFGYEFALPTSPR
jgi:hypothetical protein